MVIVRQASDEPTPGESAVIGLVADPADLHVFDAESGLRIES
jgi:hypothetical protein